MEEVTVYASIIVLEISTVINLLPKIIQNFVYFTKLNISILGFDNTVFPLKKFN